MGHRCGQWGLRRPYRRFTSRLPLGAAPARLRPCPHASTHLPSRPAPASADATEDRSVHHFYPQRLVDQPVGRDAPGQPVPGCGAGAYRESGVIVRATWTKPSISPIASRSLPKAGSWRRAPAPPGGRPPDTHGLRLVGCLLWSRRTLVFASGVAAPDLGRCGYLWGSWSGRGRTAARSQTFTQVKGPGCGAGERVRTADLPFTRRLLCQLSYTGGWSRAC